MSVVTLLSLAVPIKGIVFKHPRFLSVTQHKDAVSDKSSLTLFYIEEND